MCENNYFQDHMPGNICFGCGRDNHQGLQISSAWEGDEGVCRWQPEERYQGWTGLVNGGILATLVDCHAICTATAAEARRAGRLLCTPPFRRFATGQMTIRYVKPTPSSRPVELRARVTGVKNERVYTVQCDVYSGGKGDGERVVTAEVIAFLVHSSDDDAGSGSPFGA